MTPAANEWGAPDDRFCYRDVSGDANQAFGKFRTIALPAGAATADPSVQFNGTAMNRFAGGTVIRYVTCSTKLPNGQVCVPEK